MGLQETSLTFDELWGTQYRLQAAMGWPNGTGEAGVKENLLHVVVEAVEALREINFKNWKRNSVTVDKEALATELTDIIQFVFNAAIALDLDGVDLTKALRTKWEENRRRIEDGETT
jgi:NTP pyrophosphatase (non-canonical NTP hydrolase)